MGRAEAQRVGQRVGIAVPLDIPGIAQRRQHSLPAAVRADSGLVEHQVEIDIDQPRGVFGPLQVAAHPVQTVGDSGKHSRYCHSTQVSLLPPPCEEFTTSEPLRSATRVRPPGTMVTLSPKRT